MPASKTIPTTERSQRLDRTGSSYLLLLEKAHEGWSAAQNLAHRGRFSQLWAPHWQWWVPTGHERRQEGWYHHYQIPESQDLCLPCSLDIGMSTKTFCSTPTRPRSQGGQWGQVGALVQRAQRRPSSEHRGTGQLGTPPGSRCWG